MTSDVVFMNKHSLKEKLECAEIYYLKKRKKFSDDKKKLFIGICISFIIIASAVGVLSNEALFYSKSPETSKLNSTCSDLSLNDTAFCLRDKLKTWYNYNESNVYKELTEDELKSQGGVCWHYARWYEEQAKNLGFYTKEVSIDVNESLAHVFTVISDDEGYCVVDQTKATCNEFLR